MEALVPALLRRSAATDSSNDQNVGSAQGQNSSLSSFLSTLVVSLALFTSFMLVFIILRRSNRRIYAPRTYVLPPVSLASGYLLTGLQVGTVASYRRLNSNDDNGDGYADEIEGVRGFSNIIGWMKSIWKIPDEVVLRTNGLDGFLFLRYLRKAQMICFVGCCITFPILFPINATGGGGAQQMNLLSFSNVSKENKNRFYAHCFVGWAFFSFVLFTIYRELIYYITLRQSYMLSPFYANRISARTLLVTTIPPQYNKISKLRMIFDNAKRIWINSDTSELEKVIEKRDEIALKLEVAEVKLIKSADAARRKKGGAVKDHGVVTEEAGDESGSVAARWLPRKDRPTHRLKPIIGEKVDTIDWCRAQLAELNSKAEEMQAVHKNGEGKKFNSAFIEFDSQSAAQTALQVLAHHKSLHMAPRYIGVTPEEVVWSNLKLAWYERLLKVAATTAFVVAMVIFWSIPVAFVGAVSNINYLEQKLPWLSFISNMPPVLLGIITGLLPVVMLSILMALVPIVLRLMAKLSGEPSLSCIELKVQNYYFCFQVIQVFLVTTMTSAASAAVPTILKNPSSVTSLLAQSLPTASNFYISYMILQGLSISSGILVQIAGFVVYNLLGRFLDSTPRKMWRRWAGLAGVGWGTVFPVFTNICVIALSYSIIAPLVLIFAVLGLGLLYFAYRYNFLFVYDVNIDTKGLVYPRALYQTLTGVYLAEICLIGLFAIATAIGPLILMIVFLIFTVLFQLALTSAIEPLLKFLPKNLEKEEEALLSRDLEDGQSGRSTTQPPKMLTEASADHELSQTTASNGVEEAVLHEPRSSRTSFTPAAASNPNIFTRFLRPDRYESYFEMRKKMPEDMPEAVYDHDTERDAYMHPAVKAEKIFLWVPRDEGGVSAQEVAHTDVVNPISDEGAFFDNKGKMQRFEEANPPDWKEKVLY